MLMHYKEDYIKGYHKMKIQPIATSILLAIVCSSLGREVQSQPLTPTRQVVSARSLITPLEIAEYRHAVNTAATHEARMRIRETTLNTLRQRAISRGMIMAEPHPHPWYGSHWGELNQPVTTPTRSASDKTIGKVTAQVPTAVVIQATPSQKPTVTVGAAPERKPNVHTGRRHSMLTPDMRPVSSVPHPKPATLPRLPHK